MRERVVGERVFLGRNILSFFLPGIEAGAPVPGQGGGKLE
jgi:hypothetical protein